MAKHLAVTLLMIVALVLTSSLSSRAARPDPAFASAVKSIHPGSGEGDQAKDGVKAMDDESESCEEKSNEEECLMRRTMIAHIDYIYTQNNHH